MIKYIPRLSDIVLEEIPDKVALAVEITNCQGSCPACHSPFLKQDIGEELDFQSVDKLVSDNFGANCFLFLGEGSDPQALVRIAEYIKTTYPKLELALYSGRAQVEDELFELFDYVKIGAYVEALGPLNSPSTNQRLYYHRKDITSRFWHNK